MKDLLTAVRTGSLVGVELGTELDIAEEIVACIVGGSVAGMAVS